MNAPAPPVRFITAVARGDELHAESRLPVPWWSFTKTILAAAALALVARRRLYLDETIAGEAFTLRHLLQHRSGLPDYGSLAAYHAAVARAEAPWPIDEMLRRAGADKLASAPGHRFAYSNIGYLHVGRLIESAADMPLAAALNQLVFRPLGIRNVALACDPADLEGTVWGNAACYHPGWVYHGLLVGTASDAALLLHRLLGGHLLPSALLQAMCAAEPLFDAVPGRLWVSIGYGLGLGVCHAAGERFVGHTGAGPGSVAAVYQNSHGVTATVFAPGDSPQAVESKVIDMLAAPACA